MTTPETPVQPEASPRRANLLRRLPRPIAFLVALLVLSPALYYCGDVTRRGADAEWNGQISLWTPVIGVAVFLSLLAIGFGAILGVTLIGLISHQLKIKPFPAWLVVPGLTGGALGTTALLQPVIHFLLQNLG